MRVLLDECFPRALRAELPGHEVKTVAEAEQNFSGLTIAVIVVGTPSNDIVGLPFDSNSTKVGVSPYIGTNSKLSQFKARAEGLTSQLKGYL